MPRPRHWLLLALCAAPAVLHAQRAGYHPAPEPRLRLSSESGLRIDVLVDAAALGGAEVEVAEITFPAGGRSGGAHGRQLREQAIERGRPQSHGALGAGLDFLANGIAMLRPAGQCDQDMEPLLIGTESHRYKTIYIYKRSEFRRGFGGGGYSPVRRNRNEKDIEEAVEGVPERPGA
jgi:hypothetical protein